MPYSEDEYAIIGDRHFLLTKRKAIDHTVQLLASVKDELKSLNKSSFQIPDGAWHSMGKISKGENYRGLPFVVLDYPSFFERKNIFTFRTMFWWGNYFGIFVMCSGEMLKWSPLNRLKDKDLNSDYLINSTNDFWNFDLNKGPFEKIVEPSGRHIINLPRNTCCIARSLSLKDYRKLPEFVTQTFNECFA